MATAATLGERALRRIGVAIVPVAERPAAAAAVSVATIATNALIFLAVIASDETPMSTDLAYATARVNSVHSALVAQGFVSWASSAIPAAVADDYTVLASIQMAPAFGKAADPALTATLEARVRKVALILRAPDLATQAVQDVHDGLATRGAVRWSVLDIPAGAEFAYTLLAAAELAPQFGAQVPPGDVPMAYRHLAQMIALPPSGAPTVGSYF